jgi:hypothetical protein
MKISFLKIENSTRETIGLGVNPQISFDLPNFFLEKG